MSVKLFDVDSGGVHPTQRLLVDGRMFERKLIDPNGRLADEPFYDHKTPAETPNVLCAHCFGGEFLVTVVGYGEVDGRCTNCGFEQNLCN